MSTSLVAAVGFLFALSPVQDPSSSPGEGPWFARVQGQEGLWEGDREIGDVGTTGLMLYACLGSGNSLSVGPQRDNIGLAVAGLLRKIGSTGVIGTTLDEEADLLEHIWCTLALCETAYFDPASFPGLTYQQATWEALLERREEDGGYGSARATGWAAYAAVAARDLGLEVPEGLLGELRDDLVRRVPLAEDVASMDGRDLALRYLVDTWAQAVEGEAATESSDGVERAFEAWAAGPEGFERLDPEGRFLVASAAYQSGGRVWNLVHPMLKTGVLERMDEGDGSFPEEGKFGQHRASALAMLTLQIYFRYGRVVGMR